MKFETDRQTFNDLELLDKTKGEKSVFSIFNFTKSLGGKKRLESIFSNPLTDVELLRKRVETIRSFQGLSAGFEIDKECLDFVEFYLIQQNVPKRFSVSDSYLKALKNKIKPKNEYYIIQRGIRLLIALLNDLYSFSISPTQEHLSGFIKKCKPEIREKIENTALKSIIELKKSVKFTPYQYGKLDHCFRKVEIDNIRQLLEIIYETDVYMSLANAIIKHGLTLPSFTEKPNYFHVDGLFHPFLDKPVSNDFDFVTGKNLCFLTGPNMAGKSTFLKSISISVYLSHIGFPVPATYLETSIFNGLFTTINLADNLNKGYSHFYNEVLRVKYVAERINQTGNIFVVFDELFRGTNVKDAYEASLSVITAFSKINRGVFAISTHIIEIADELKNNDSIIFKYFEANLVNEIPEYNYKIKDGVTDERIGMYILKKEKVLETIEHGTKQIN